MVIIQIFFVLHALAFLCHLSVCLDMCSLKHFAFVLQAPLVLWDVTFIKKKPNFVRSCPNIQTLTKFYVTEHFFHAEILSLTLIFDSMSTVIMLVTISELKVWSERKCKLFYAFNLPENLPLNDFI